MTATMRQHLDIVKNQFDSTNFPGWGSPLFGTSLLNFIMASADGEGYIGIGTDLYVYTHQGNSLDGTNWVQQNYSASVVSIAANSAGEYFATGTDNRIYYNTDIGNQGWGLTQSASLFTCIAFYTDGSILGVGTDGFLYQLASVDAGVQSEMISNSQVLQNVTVLGNGTIAAVNTDGYLLLRETLTSDWQVVAGSGTILTVAQTLDNNHLMAIGTDNRIYKATFSPTA